MLESPVTSRTANRRDLAVSPFAPTVLDKLNKLVSILMQLVRLTDNFNGAGINHDMGHQQSNSHGMDTLIKTMGLLSLKGILIYQLGRLLMRFTDTVAMPMVTAIACIEFDERLPEIIAVMREDDLLMITADMVTTQPTLVQTIRVIHPFLAYSPSFKGSGVIPLAISLIFQQPLQNFGVERP